MNKVFHYGEKAKQCVAHHDEFLLRAKAGLCGFLGEDRANNVCSCLDHADYVYIDPYLAPKKKTKLKEKVARKISASKFLFKNSDFAKYYLKTMFKKDMNADKESVYDTLDGLRRIVYSLDRDLDEFYSIEVDTKTGKIGDFVTILVGDSNNTKLHELLHLVSSRAFTMGGRNEHWYIAKRGLSCNNNYEMLNELFTDYLADLIDDYMQKNDMPLLGTEQKSKSAYNVLFKYVKDIFSNNFDMFLNAYFGNDLSELDEHFGAENLEILSTSLENLFYSNIKHNGTLNKYLKYKTTSGTKNLQKMRKSISIRLNDGCNFNDAAKDFDKGIEDIMVAREKCLKEAANKSENLNEV